jgi:xanthine dehydrogenase accessory factor
MGISDEQLARIHNPIGLNLGGRRPEEIALAIMAEIVAVRNGVEGCS